MSYPFQGSHDVDDKDPGVRIESQALTRGSSR